MLVLLLTALPPHYQSKVEELYFEYRESLYYFALKIVRDRELARDIVQQAFIKIINNIEKIDDLDSYGSKGYILYIVRNLCLDQLRKKKRVTLVPYEKIEFSAQDMGDSIEDIVMTGIDIELIKEKMEELDDKYSLPLILMYSLEYTYAEIADLLDITVQNARIRCFRGKKMLVEALGKETNHGEKAQ